MAAAWWSSLESLFRVQNILLWVATLAAIVVAASGIFGYFINGRIASLRQLAAQQLTTSQAELAQRQQEEAHEVGELRQLLEASETRSEGFLNRIDELDAQLAALSAERDKWRREAAQKPKAPEKSAPDVLTPEQRTKMLTVLRGSPVTRLTILTLAENASSRRLGNQLAEVIAEAGWTTDVAAIRLDSPPPGHTFVVHSQETTPDTAITLSVALAIVEVMGFPPKLMLDPDRPAGFLGLIIVDPTR